MRKTFITLSTWVSFLAFLFVAIGMWNIFKERNVSHTAITVEADKIQLLAPELVYATVVGGYLDHTNMYEFGISSKNSDEMAVSYYYTPVVKGSDQSFLYILKTDNGPKLESDGAIANYTGLLRSESELPEKIASSYRSEYPGKSLLYLDSMYQPETIIEKVYNLKVFLILLFAGLGVRILLSKNKPSPASGENESIDKI